jgi:hypothetical protein
MRIFLLAWSAALVMSIPDVLRAEHFDIKLVATGPGEAKCEAYADQSPPASGLNPRPVLKLRSGDQITFQFVMTNVYAHASARNAGAHYYVVRERAIGQKEPPSAQERPVIEGRLSFDLKPKSRIGARERFIIREPGAYLLRVESQRTQRDHEHFSAIDLQVQ